MTEPSPLFWHIFFQVYEPLPRQGPGNRACAARALQLCVGLPAAPMVLDLGCGVGGQTLQLAELLPSSVITAVDCHAPSIERLQAAVAARDLSHRLRPLVGDMATIALEPASFDLVWSEGALYNLASRPRSVAAATCCARAATWRSPTPSGARRIHRPRSRRASTSTIRPWAGCPTCSPPSTVPLLAVTF